MTTATSSSLIPLAVPVPSGRLSRWAAAETWPPALHSTVAETSMFPAKPFLPICPQPSVLCKRTCGTDTNCNATTSTSFDDAFVVAINANLSSYKYFTYYGGSNVDDAFGITADSAGNAFVTGTTASTDLLSPGTSFQSSLLGTQNAFLLELNSTGSAVTYNTYLGGDGTDIGLGVTLDSLGTSTSRVRRPLLVFPSHS